MRDLDERDREILRLLVEDGRRAYSEIAETVDLSAPAVSDRVDRLAELGVIRRFTVDVDRSMLREGTPTLVTIECRPGAGKQVYAPLAEQDAVEHVYQTTDDIVVAVLIVPRDVGSFLAEVVPLDVVENYTVRLLTGSSWNPTIDDASLAIDCAECGNTVTAEGVRERLDGTVYHFCCPSCQSRFVEQYEDLKERA